MGWVQDRQGLPVSNADAMVIEAIDQLQDLFISYRAEMPKIDQAAEARPDCLLAQLYGATLYMFVETAEAPAMVRRYLDAAEALASSGTEHERMLLAAISAWAAGDMTSSLRWREQIADLYPQDLFSAKIGQINYFNLGRSAGILRLGAKLAEHHADNPYLHGMLAFGYEQCHLLTEAEAAARKAMAMQHQEPWAQHALAHVLETRGAVEEGVRFLEGVSDGWAGLNSFMRTHNWWHLALYYLERDQHDRVLDLYDRQIWGVDKNFSQDQINAISMLLRLELRGVDVGARWHDIADFVASRPLLHLQPFLDMQYVYALARAGRSEADQWLEGIRRHAGQIHPDRRFAWQMVCLPACEAMIAHARGIWHQAQDRMEQALPHLAAIGGSHAQRDLFELVRLDALMRLGDWEQVQQILELRRLARPNIPSIHRALSQTYTALTLPRQAGRAAKRAGELTAYYACLG